MLEDSCICLIGLEFCCNNIYIFSYIDETCLLFQGFSSTIFSTDIGTKIKKVFKGSTDGKQLDLNYGTCVFS